jgi:hypothetical protein
MSCSRPILSAIRYPQRAKRSPGGGTSRMLTHICLPGGRLVHSIMIQHTDGDVHVPLVRGSELTQTTWYATKGFERKTRQRFGVALSRADRRVDCWQIEACHLTLSHC